RRPSCLPLPAPLTNNRGLRPARARLRRATARGRAGRGRVTVMTPAQPKLEWQRALTTLAAVAVAVVVVAALYWARSIFIPVALAVCLAFVMAPVVRWLERRRFGRLPAVLTTVTGGVVVAGLTGGLVAWQLADLSKTVADPENSGKITAKLRAARNWVVG